MFTVKQLMQKLQQLVKGGLGELGVLLSSDAEGNSFSPVDEMVLSEDKDCIIIYPEN